MFNYFDMFCSFIAGAAFAIFIVPVLDLIKAVYTELVYAINHWRIK